jgi:hypothetical protein
MVRNLHKIFLPALAAAGVMGAATPSQAALCNTYTTIGDLAAASGASCTLSSGWTFTYKPTTTLPLTTLFTFSGSASIATLSLQGDPNPFSPGTYNYNFSLTAPPTRYMTKYSSSITSSVSPADAGTWGITSAATGQQALGTYVSPNGVTANKFYGTTTTYSDIFTGVMTVSGGQITQFTSSFNTALIPVGTPGPLPILGASAAFAYSRRIRRRAMAA